MSSAKLLIDFCIEKKISIATMESCTGGCLVNKLTDIVGSSEVVKDSFVTYSNEAKIEMGIREDIIEKYTPYSAAVASEMSIWAYNNSISPNTAGIGITGSLSRVDPANKENSVPGEVYFGIYYCEKNLIDKIIVPDGLDRKDCVMDTTLIFLKKYS